MTRRGLLAIAVLGALLLAPSAVSSPSVLPRATQDRPDEVQGPQIHVVYVVPQDGSDRSLDTNGTINASVTSWQRWLRGQSGGRGIRLDTFQGDLDVSFFRLAATDAVVASRGPFVRDAVAQELLAAGFNSPDKIYAVYYDGSSTFSCGGAGPPPGAQGSVTVIYLRGNPPGSPACASNPIGVDPPGYFEFAMLHEIVHTMGFVPTCAPHVTLRDHVSDSRFDLMWSGDAPWGVNEPGSMTLDVGRDDYYNARIPGCLDMSGSRFLEGGGVRLAIEIGGAASAAVSVNPGQACTASCVRYFDVWPVPRVTLEALPPDGRTRFVSWSGACTGASPTCNLDLAADASVSAVFGRATVQLAVSTSGRGKVTSTPRGVSCPPRCRATFAIDSVVRLNAAPRKGWRFAGWRGACRGTRACRVALPANRTVRAVFRKAPRG